MSKSARAGWRTRAGLRTAATFVSRDQKAAILLLAVLLVVSATLEPKRTLILLVAICTAFYTLTAALKLVVSLAGRSHRPLWRERVEATDPDLPHYGVLLPVHKEANMLRHLVARVDRLEYPKDRLHVLLLIEQDDEETLAAARAIGLRFAGAELPERVLFPQVQVVVIPEGGPKTKPNAMNVAMSIIRSEGCEYCTIYDAEDQPDPDQLLRAIGMFRAAPPEMACLQAELEFWNDDTNWVSALYWIGYKVHFLRFLPGLARLGLPIPLGGTSNHFKVEALLRVAIGPDGHVWDPHNLTEDADLGARLVSAGYRIELLDSVTREEAPVSMAVVDKQQRRWKGGYLQTGLVHTRRPVVAARRMGLVRWLCFNLLMIGTPLAFVLNPVFMALTATYFLTRSYFIVELFPAAVYYPCVALLVLGNLALLHELIETCLQEAGRTRGGYGLIKYMFLAPLMWLWMSRSTYIAIFELATGKRGWHKTPHGHALDESEIAHLDFGGPDGGDPPARQSFEPVTAQLAYAVPETTASADETLEGAR